MERIKKMDKFTVLSEIKKLMKSKEPIKATSFHVNREIFYVPEEKIKQMRDRFQIKL